MADNRSGLIEFAAFAMIFLAFAGLLLVSVSDDDSSANIVQGNYEYSVSGTEATLVKYSGLEVDITLQHYVIDDDKEYKLTAIGSEAFMSRTSIVTVNMSDDIKTIGTRAFYGCTSLQVVNTNVNLKEIGAHAFEGCKSLITITFPDSIDTFGEYAFAGCESLTKVTIKENKYLTKIPKYLFSSCTRLAEVNIPNTVTTIDSYAFAECTSLKTVAFPLDSYLRTLGDYAFSKCDSLPTFTFTKYVMSIGNGCFSYCSSLNNITLPSDYLDKIGDLAFLGCKTLKSITIPKCVTTIGYGPFAKCSSLNLIRIEEGSISFTTFQTVLMDYSRTRVIQAPCSISSIALPNSISSIEAYSFAGCDEMTEITLPSSIAGIGDYAFMNCASLTSIHIPKGVTTIGENVFLNCDSLEKITVDENNTKFKAVDYVLYSIDQKRLVKCPEKKTGVYNISSPVETIDGSALFNCLGITKFTVDPNNKYYSADDTTGALYNKDKTTLVSYPSGSEATSFSIGNTVTNIDEYCFGKCPYLKEITVSKGSEYYSGADGVLYNKSGSTLIYYPSAKAGEMFALPEYVTKVNSYAFFGCATLQNIRMTTSLVSFGIESISVGSFTDYRDFNISGNSDRVFPSYAYNEYTNSPTPKTESNEISLTLIIFIIILVIVVILILLIVRKKYSS